MTETHRIPRESAADVARYAQSIGLAPPDLVLIGADSMAHQDRAQAAAFLRAIADGIDKTGEALHQATRPNVN